MEYKKLTETFSEKFGKDDHPLYIYFAPGRVNLIGEHIDYNGGLVFPCAINRGTYLLLRKTNSDSISFYSTNFPAEKIASILNISRIPGDSWINYPLGVMHEFSQRGFPVKGFELFYSGNIPNGAGLSSSASIELVTAYALNDILQSRLDKLELVKLSQKAENEFVGVNCGIMDQFAVGFGRKNHALALQCDTLDYEEVPLVMEGYKLVIANSKIRRELASSKYHERQKECQAALKDIRTQLPIQHLAEMNSQLFRQHASSIQGDIPFKRAHHVVTENERVKQAIQLLKNNEISAFGELMNQSHISLRDDYEVTGKELDLLAETAWQIPGVIGARMTGAGFGGCTINIVEEKQVETFKEKLGTVYHDQTGITPEFYTVDMADGVRKISGNIK